MAAARSLQFLTIGLGFVSCVLLIAHVRNGNVSDTGCAACPRVTELDKQILATRCNSNEMVGASASFPGIGTRSFMHTKTELLQKAMEGLVGDGVKADDSRVVDVLQKHVIDLPSPYMAKMSYPLFKTPQAEAVDKLLHGKTEGFFIECGGLDGERSSNTIFFEQKRAWQGLVVEMDPSWYLQILGKNRRAYSINACISPYDYPIKMDIKEHRMGEGKLVRGDSKGSTDRQAFCFPFLSMMLALNRTHIDYFSLDVEGFELDILKTIPFDRIDISVLTVEHKHGQGGEKAYVEFMKSKGYYKHSRIEKYKPEIYFGCNDLVFVKSGFRV